MAGFNLNNLLNGKSKEAAVQKQEAEGQTEVKENAFEVVMIGVEDLMPSKDNFYSTEGIDELADAIELAGRIEQNLTVKPQAHGKYEIIAGHRRRLAALKLVKEGKEEYKKVPCHIKTESDDLKDELTLILTNSSARQLNDWEKVQQAKRLKEILTDYKKALEEENKDKPKEERQKLGRIREIVASMLNTSTTQIGRMEAIDNNLSDDFKEELAKGNINISTAHELSRKIEEEQAQAYKQYKEKGEIHIKDVKEEPKPEITDEQSEWVQMAITDAIKGKVNREVFNAKSVEQIEKALRKRFEKTFEGKKIELEEGKHFTYRFQAEGITVIDMDWENYLVEYSDLAEIVQIMMENDLLQYDDTEEEENNDFMNEPEEETEGSSTGDRVRGDNRTQKEKDEEEEDNEPLPGQQNIMDTPEVLTEVKEKGLSFTSWISKRYQTGQYDMIKRVVRDTILTQAEESKEICPKEWEDRLTNAVSVWVMEKTEEYKKYLQE